jgi:uncharacterized membrane protein YkoI
MKNAIVAVVSLLAIGSEIGLAQEKKLTKEHLPAAVAATIERETQGSTVKGYSTEKDHGRTVYEAEAVVSGHTRDIQVAADGKLNEIEEEVAMTSLPQEVQSSLTAKAKGAEITKVESLTKKGLLVAYEASTLKSGKKGEIQVGPKGEKLSHEE